MIKPQTDEHTQGNSAHQCTHLTPRAHIAHCRPVHEYSHVTRQYISPALRPPFLTAIPNVLFSIRSIRPPHSGSSANKQTGDNLRALDDLHLHTCT